MTVLQHAQQDSYPKLVQLTPAQLQGLQSAVWHAISTMLMYIHDMPQFLSKRKLA